MTIFSARLSHFNLSAPFASVTRRRSGIQLFLSNSLTCGLLGFITLLFADGGGIPFAIGAGLTLIWGGVLIRQISLLVIGFALRFRFLTHEGKTR